MPIVRCSLPMLQFGQSLFIVRCVAVFLVMFLTVLGVSAQSLRQFISYGDDATKRGSYYEAAEYYRQGLEKYMSNVELKMKYAESQRAINNYQQAAEYYKQVVDEDLKREFPMALFWLGVMLQSQGKYENALMQFKKFKIRYKQRDYFSDRTQRAIAACNWAKEHSKDSAKITITHLGDSVNTSFTEFNPFQNSTGQLWYSTLRNIAGENEKPHFLSRFKRANDSAIAFESWPIINPELHVANASFTSDFRQIFFTQCQNETENKSKLRCEIYSSRWDGAAWSETEKLPAKINIEGSTTTHPHVAELPDGYRYLLFASDRPGGQGKLDIWSSRMVNGTFETPVNLGPEINTPDDELSPFYDNEKNQLYFASDGLIGYGGLDIFSVAVVNGNSFSVPQNLGPAINSPADDFQFYMATDRSQHYFVSNRPGTLSNKGETCCNDIWSYQTGRKIAVKILRDSIVAEKRDTPIATKIDSTTAAITPLKTTRLLDSIPTTNIDKTYFDKRLEKMKQLLPVTLYFHNDEPECCNLRDTTALNYVTTYEAYWQRLSEYKREFAKGLTEGKKLEAEHAIFVLFTNKVEKGYYDLIRFSRQLWEVLEAGGKVEVTLQGYCSPLNYNAYNIKLGYRRVASLRNYFFNYRNGLFMRFVNNGQLILKSESLGEETAEKGLSDSREDTRNSVYNPAAAKERKVEIISVELK